MKRAVIYARVSTDRQADEGLSVDSQIEACRKRAAELDAVVLQVYRDDGISGTTDARPGFRRAIAHCAAVQADYMLCWSSSRFARDQHDAITYKRELAAAGTRLVYASSGLDLATNEGWLADSFQQIIDEHYSRQVSADTRRSMISAARDGYWMGGRVPYGYEAVPATDDGRRRRLRPQEAEAEVVRGIFARSARGIGAYAIAVLLNEQGLTLRGRPWTKNTILNMLKSEVYMGQVIYNRFERKRQRQRAQDEWIRVQAHEPLVDDDVFAAVQQGLIGRAPAEGRAPGNAEHVFAGMLRCGLCGSSLKLANGTGRNGTVYYYYACSGDLQGKKCGFKRMRADQFDTWMLDELMTHVLTRENVQGVIDQLDATAATWTKERAARRSALVLEVRAVEGRRSKLYEVLETHGKDAPGISEMGPRLRELNDQAKRLEAALAALEAEPEPIVGTLGVSADEAAGIMRQMVDECESPKALRAFVASIVDVITVEEKEVRVDYHPDCLIRQHGAMVHSTRNWLPDLGSNQGPTD